MKRQTNNIKKHEQQYWHIPKFSLLPVLGLIVFTLLSIGNFMLIDMDIVKTAFSCEKDNCNLVLADLIVLYPIVMQYILIVSVIISLIALFKGGYNKLKSYKDKGLTGGLILGLIVGLIVELIVELIVGLIWGLIWGLILGLIWGLIWGLILGLIWGLIFGLILGLIWGLIFGLIWEFEK